MLDKGSRLINEGVCKGYVRTHGTPLGEGWAASQKSMARLRTRSKPVPA